MEPVNAGAVHNGGEPPRSDSEDASHRGEAKDNLELSPDSVDEKSSITSKNITMK